MSCPFAQHVTMDSLRRLADKQESKIAATDSSSSSSSSSLLSGAGTGAIPDPTIDDYTVDHEIPFRGRAHLNPSTAATSVERASTSSSSSGGISLGSLGADLADPLRAWIRQGGSAARPKQRAVARTYTEEITYWNYIHPQVLTSLQKGREGKGLNHHEEHLFIVVHQVFELWFKQVIWELEFIRDVLVGEYKEADAIPRALQRSARADAVFRLATQAYEIMETMDPSDFLEFRDYLTPSSGFQSVQLREIEILMGLKDDERLKCAGRDYREAFRANQQDLTHAFDKRLSEPTIKDALYAWLERLGGLMEPALSDFKRKFLAVKNKVANGKIVELEEQLAFLAKLSSSSSSSSSSDHHDEGENKHVSGLKALVEGSLATARASTGDVEEFFTFKNAQSGTDMGLIRTTALFLMTYHAHPTFRNFASLLHQCLRIEQASLLWRQRHARMVELFIGRRKGTGGSSGVDYIDATASTYRVFADLWRVRSLAAAASSLEFDPDRIPLSDALARAAMGAVSRKTTSAATSSSSTTAAAPTATSQTSAGVPTAVASSSAIH